MTAAGLVLLVLGVLVALSEAHNPTHGIAGTVGVALMTVGVALALIGAGVAVAIGVGSGAVLAAGGGAALVATVRRAQTVRHRRVTTGAEGLIGQVGVVRAWREDDGSVSLQGAVWRARRSPGIEYEADEPPAAMSSGDHVVVERLDGLTLTVRPAEAWELL
jgi:membrane-bound serine protease (ClpP class)